MIAMFLNKGPAGPGATWTAIVNGVRVTKISSAEMRVRTPSARVMPKITKTTPLSQRSHEGSPIVPTTSRQGDSSIRWSI